MIKKMVSMACILMLIIPNANAMPKRIDYQIYKPEVNIDTIYPEHSHDATIIYFGDRFYAQWDTGLEDKGQYILQSTSTDGKSWTPPIRPYSSEEGSINPISSTYTQFQPSLVVVGGELWSFYYVTEKGVYFAKLNVSAGKWENEHLFGDAPARYPYPMDEGIQYKIFPGNNGMITSTGRVAIPVTLMQKGVEFFSAKKKDGIIYTDDGGKNFGVSHGVTMEKVQAWEATIWEPVPGRINMLSRRNRTGALFPKENIKYTMSYDNGITWQPQKLLPIELAMSRPYVVQCGGRSILAQNDSGFLSQSLMTNRKNLSLFFARAAGFSFIPGLNVDYQNKEPVDYPQMVIKDEKAYIIYTSQPGSNALSRQTRLATVMPLPKENAYYIFPRNARGRLEEDVVNGRRELIFYDNYSSATVDSDDFDFETANMHIGFSFNVQTDGMQEIMSYGYPELTILSMGGKLYARADGKLHTVCEMDGITDLDVYFTKDNTVIEVGGKLYVLRHHFDQSGWFYLGVKDYLGRNMGFGQCFGIFPDTLFTQVIEKGNN